MSIRYKTCLMILFITTNVFAFYTFQYPTNEECKLRRYAEWDNITCAINNKTIFTILFLQNDFTEFHCTNLSDWSDFNLNMTLGTCKRIEFNCNLSNNSKPIDIVRKLGLTEETCEQLLINDANNLTLRKHHLEGLKNIKQFFIWKSNVFHIDKDLLADLKELKHLHLSYINLQHWNAEFFDYASQLDKLSLFNNNMKFIKPSMFDKLKNLKELFISNRHNHSTEFQLGIFDKLVTLENLDINQNNLVSLPKDIFVKLKNLKFLNIGYNNFTDLPRNLLRNNTKLETFWLYFNQKNLTLSDGFFSNLTNLKSVILHNNRLVTLPEDLFWGSTLLQKIDLNNNCLHFLNVNIFRNLTELQELYLDFNNLENLPDNIFQSTNKLKILILSNNRITNISEQLFNGLYSLKELSMKRNYLKTISTGSFRTLEKLEAVYLSNNHLEVLPDEIFSNNMQLRILNLSNNRITNISEQLFNGLYSLEELSMQRNYLKTISTGTFRSLEKLEALYLSNNHLGVLPNEIFSNNTKLKILNLSNNRITAISKNLFFGLSRLEEINMEQNHLSNIRIDKNNSFEYLQKVKIINLSNNNLTFEADLYSPFYYCSLLKELYLANNNISKLSSDWILKHSFLNILDLSYNSISSINTEELLFSSGNIIVNLTHNKIQQISLDYFKRYTTERSKTNRNVKVLVEHNPLNCDCDVLYNLVRYNEGKMHNAQSYFQMELRNSICHSPKEMEEIRLSNLYSRNLTCRVRNTNSNTVCPKKCDCFLRPYDKAFIFDCSNKNLTSVPDDIKKPDISSIQRAFTTSIDSISQFELDFSYNMLMHMPNLKTIELGLITKLILSHNNISEIFSDGLSTTIKVLELHNNSLSRIPPNVLRIWKSSNLTRLTLHENPWVCDCDAVELLNFTQTKYQILPKVSKIMCHREKKFISEMTFIDFCPFDTTVIFSTTTAIALIGLITGIFGLYYKYQTYIKIWLFAHQWCLWFVTEEKLDKDKLYDAFVSFSHKDNDFVENEMVPKLESGSTPFKLCLHYRDWLAGEFIPDNIARSVENSRRTIVVLSPNFLESVWGRMEFRAAHCQALKEGRARVIMILYGDVEPTDDLDPELKAYISMNTYIRWDDPWFWDKLKYALPHQSRRPICNSPAQKDILKTQV